MEGALSGTALAVPLTSAALLTHVLVQASYPLENLAYLAEEFCRVYLGLPAGSDPVGDELNRDFNLCGSAGVNAVWDSLVHLAAQQLCVAGHL